VNHYVAFVGLSIAVLVFPGPSILLIVANSLQRGRIFGLYTMVGGVVAMAVQMTVAIIGLTSLVDSTPIGFDLVLVRFADRLLEANLGALQCADQLCLADADQLFKLFFPLTNFFQ